jgi:RNA recognition motif-containing protein
LNDRYEDITRLFERYGKIVDIRIPIDYNSRTSRGFAFVQFEDVGDAEEAMYKLDKKILLGREIGLVFFLVFSY